MKTKILLFISGLFLLIGCHDDLNIAQKGEITSASMWQDEGDVNAAVYGMYNKFRSTFSSNYVYWGEYRNGMWGEGLTSQSTRDDIYLNKINSSNGSANWTDLYTTINNCNLIIKYAPRVAFTNETNRNKAIANALYVRAYCYYWIARIWGDAPLLVNGFESDNQEGLYPSREPVSHIYTQIATDLSEAARLMPTSVTDRGMASQGAINILTADYYLWMAKVAKQNDALTKAKDAISKVLSNSNYGLAENYSSIFETEGGKEVIFAWKYIKDEFTGGYPSDYLVPTQYVSTAAIENPVKVGSHQQWCFYTTAYKAFLSSNENDQRKKASFETYFDAPKNETFQWINKFAGTWENSTRIFDADVIAYRYADALLFSAEIENELGNTAAALDTLNKIAKRAYGIDDYYKNLNKEQINEKIMDERLKEFAAEGKTWWDMVRMGVAFKRVPSLVGRENEQNILLWPVHSSTISRNSNIKQTLGYD